MIKYFGVSLLFIWTLGACQKENKGNTLADFQQEAAEIRKKQINFNLNAIPKDFSATTLSGKIFNSKDFKDKNLIIFIYPKSYFTKTDSYDLATELNDIYTKYNNKASFIGIIEGNIENNQELTNALKKSRIQFDQIDNTQSLDKSSQISYNTFCYPAKILINREGKVIHSSCGGGSNEALINKLDSIQ